jgi:hypothetical protein
MIYILDLLKFMDFVFVRAIEYIKETHFHSAFLLNILMRSSPALSRKKHFHSAKFD